MERPANFTHEVDIWDAEGSARTVRALIECGATSTFISPKPAGFLGIRKRTVPAYTTTRAPDGSILIRVGDSRRLSLNVGYLLPDESDALVVMTLTTLSWGCRGFKIYA